MSVLSDPQRFRKLVAGAALIGFPVAGLASCLTDSAEGTGQSWGGDACERHCNAGETKHGSNNSD